MRAEFTTVPDRVNPEQTVMGLRLGMRVMEGPLRELRAKALIRLPLSGATRMVVGVHLAQTGPLNQAGWT
eukprot:2671764-Amphidinium_carterae.1